METVRRKEKIVWKQNSPETEPAVLWAYAENQATLEPILYHESKCKQTEK